MSETLTSIFLKVFPHFQDSYVHSYVSITRSSYRKCSSKKVFLKICQNSQENTCVGIFFNKVAGLRSATLLKKRLWHRLFSCEFWQIYKNTFLQNTFGRLILDQCFSNVFNVKAIFSARIENVFSILFH